MVSRAEATRRQNITKARNKIANDKQQAVISGAKMSREDNRGFNTKSISGGGRSVSAEQRANNLASDIQNGTLVTSQGDIQALQNYFTFTNGKFSDVEKQAIAKLRAGRHLGAVSNAVRKNLAKVEQRNFDKSQFSTHATKQTITKNLKIARATVASTRNAIRTKQANIKTLERSLASLNTPASINARKVAYNKLSRSQKRKGGLNPTSQIKAQLQTAKSDLAQLNKALPGIEQTVKQTESAKMKSEIDLGNRETVNDDGVKPQGFANNKKKVIMGKGNVPGLIGGINLLQTKNQGVKESKNDVLGATWVKSDNSITSLKKGLERTQAHDSNGNKFQTSSSMFGNNPVTNFIDDKFELNKLPKNRSQSNQKVAGFLAPTTNFLGDIDDLGKAISKGSKGFEQGNTNTLLGSYFQVPKQTNPKIDTASGNLLSGKKVNLKDPIQSASVFGDIAFIGGAIVLGGGVKSPGSFKGTPSGGFASQSIGLGKGPGKSFNHKSSIVGETAKAKHQLRPGPPRNVFALDKADGLSSALKGKKQGGFTSQTLGLGVGSVKGSGSINSLFGKGGYTKPRTFKEPKPSKGDKLIGNKGSQQILKTKNQSITKILGGQTKVTNRMFGVKTKSTKNDILHKKPKANKQHQGGTQSYFLGVVTKPKGKSGFLAQIQKQKIGTWQGAKQGFKQKQTPKQLFKQTPKQTFKQSPKLKQPLITTQKFVPFGPTTTKLIPPTFRPPVKNTRIFPPGGIPLFPAGGRGSYMGQRRKSAFRKYTTTAISSDINQKILPGKFLKTSRSRKIYTQLDKLQRKEDKKTKPTFLFGGKTNTINGKVNKKKKGKGLPGVSGNTARALGL